MDQKLKLVVLILVALLGLGALLFMQTYGAKQALERERNVLKTDNEALARKTEDAQREAQRLQNKLNEIGQELDRASKDKSSLQAKIDDLEGEKAGLAEQLKAAQARRPQIVEAAPVAVPGAAEGAVPPPQDAYWADILKSKMDLEMQVGDIRNQLRNLQISNEQLARDKDALVLEGSNLAREKADLKRQLEYNQKIMDGVAAELVREKNDKFQIQESVRPFKEENALLRKQLKAMNNRKIVLERKILEQQSDINDLNKKLYDMETMLKDKALRVDNLQQELEARKSGVTPASLAKQDYVQLPPIVVRPQGGTPEVQAPDSYAAMGKVLAVNRDNNFVIIDLGEEAGIKMGNALNVYRSGKPIASVEVIQIRKSISACDIKSEGSPIKVGDVVK